jgi:TonB-dependent SusC/RagA subfamily outer membrane receptor
MNQLASERARAEDKRLDEYYAKTMHGRPDNIIYGSELPKDMNVMEALKGRVPGLTITGDRVIIRGVNTIMGSTDPLALLDDVPTDISVLWNIPTLDVDRVEIFKGPSTAIYGLRGANGVIAVYTKHGEFMKKGELDFTLFGYQRPGDFIPGQSGTILRELNIPETLLWIPNLTSQKINSNKMIVKKPASGRVITIIFEGQPVNGYPFKILENINIE